MLFPLLFAWTIGLSAVGGVVGAWLQTRDPYPPSEDVPEASAESVTEPTDDSGY